MDFKKIGFIGLGLIGGSMAKTIKRIYPETELIATSGHLSTITAAFEDHTISNDTLLAMKDFSDCDIIFLCCPVQKNIEYIKELKPFLKKGCILSDVGSVKGDIHESITALDLESFFIGGHPMAGSEKTGYENSSSSIIKGARYIITPTKETKPEKIEFMKQFASDVGMNPIVMDYHVHDKSVAAISHVPHLLSTALVHVVSDNDDEEKHMQLLAAGCFRDMSRVAASSPEMWEQICLTNSSAISNILEQYIEMLETIKDNIDKKTPGYVASLFEMSREYRNSLESRHPEH